MKSSGRELKEVHFNIENRRKSPSRRPRKICFDHDVLGVAKGALNREGVNYGSETGLRLKV